MVTTKSDLAPFLTILEAAAMLRIGRTAAYEQARRYLATDGREGLPVVRLGRMLRVPSHALARLADLSQTGESDSPGPSGKTSR
jgi:hypothetical protein